MDSKIIKTDGKGRISPGRSLVKPDTYYQAEVVGNVLMIVLEPVVPETNPEALAAVARWREVSRRPDGSEKTLRELEDEGNLVATDWRSLLADDNEEEID